MAQHLLIRLRGPLIAFGGEVIDNHGVIRDFPALSMVTGLLANALGWDRRDVDQHNRLQARLLMGARLEEEGTRLVDFQTAQLQASDQGWTTRGVAEGRAGGAGSYTGPHLRYRHYHADMNVLITLRLKSPEESPTLNDLGAALDKPVRPLFVGRKNCLPTGRLVAGWIEAENILQALQNAPPMPQGAVRAQWPDGEGRLTDMLDRGLEVCDERNWTSGVHGGWRHIREGLLRFATTALQQGVE